MANGIAFKVKGLDQLAKKLKNKPIEIKEEVVGEIQDFAGQIKEKATSLAPINDGALRQGIIAINTNDGANIESNARYSAFVEFGTGKKVRVPAELSQYAAQFKNAQGGSFQDMLKNLRSWCRKKGIPEAAAFPIAIKILNEGLEARPFFFKPFFEERGKLLTNIKKIIAK